VTQGLCHHGAGAGFDDVALGAEQNGFADGGAVIYRGADHEFRGATNGAFAQALQQFQPAELGHFDIQKHQIEQSFWVSKQGPSGLAVFRQSKLMLRPLGENAGQQIPVKGFIFSDQDVHGAVVAVAVMKKNCKCYTVRAISFSSTAAVLQINTAPMNPVLKLLLEGSQLTTTQIAQVAGLTDAEVNQHLDQLKKDKIFLGWRPVLDLSHEAVAAAVRAVIEVRITPERGGGFNRLAERIGRFDEVESCYLMSGGYDLLLFIKGSSLQKVASFVSEKLSTIEGVLSTSTHFMLRCYKDQGYLFDQGEAQTTRFNVAP